MPNNACLNIESIDQNIWNDVTLLGVVASWSMRASRAAAEELDI
jgi:hypothetical protein